ncbi:MAG: GAF domain-containing protein [Acidobacteriota bacterium]
MAGLRPYGALKEEARRLSRGWKDRGEAFRALTGLLWEGLGTTGVDWLGFYVPDGEGRALVLAACRPVPACSPIGLHGVCGRAFLERRAQVVPDVHALGENHIVCDPRNLSEVVVPWLDGEGRCVAVLDLDSRTLAAFTEEDARGLAEVLEAAALP